MENNNIENNIYMNDKENIDVAEILLSCFGRNKLGEANVEISSSLLNYTGDDTDEAKSNEFNYEEISTRFSRQGEFLFEARDGLAQVDIKYKSNMDPEFRLLWQQLEDYGKRLSDYNLTDEPEDGYPLLFYTVVPDEYSDKYYISLTNPFMWVLQPESPDEEKCKILRLFFKSENIDIKEIPEAVDVTQAEAEAARTYNVIYTEN